ncbi:MAG: hypothetical protein ACP5OZ_02980 [Candidatus Woesearchaeota archaeon]
MFKFFKKKSKEEENISEQEKLDQAEEQQINVETQKQASLNIEAEVLRLKSTVEALGEVRKATEERLGNLSQQVGELRGMIVDRDKQISQIEVKATKAADLVQAVHPEELMSEVKREDAKIEAVKAMVESKELVLKQVLDEMKQLRTEVNKFKGIEEIIKMSKEVSQELINIKKERAIIERHSNKVETLFVEMQKEFNEFKQLQDKITDLTKTTSDMNTLVDKLKISVEEAAKQKELSKLSTNFEEFKKQVTNIVDLFNKKFVELQKNTRLELQLFQEAFNKKAEEKLKEIEEKIDEIKKKEAEIKATVR